jgi:hypothetical protein
MDHHEFRHTSRLSKGSSWMVAKFRKAGHLAGGTAAFRLVVFPSCCAQRVAGFEAIGVASFRDTSRDVASAGKRWDGARSARPFSLRWFVPRVTSRLRRFLTRGYPLPPSSRASCDVGHSFTERPNFDMVFFWCMFADVLSSPRYRSGAWCGGRLPAREAGDSR